MIKLEKVNEPDYLKKNKNQWRKEYLSYFDFDGIKYHKKSGSKIPVSLIKRYNNKLIKDILLEETNKKCAYCESKMLHVDYSDIEHIKPKKHVPELIYEWSNLTIACVICNRDNKKDYYDEKSMLINPFEEDPEDSLLALGPLIQHRAGNKKGTRTHKKLELNRAELIERRIERIESVSSMIDLWCLEEDSGHKEILYEEIKREMEQDKEYSLVVKYLLLSKGVI
ncbi:uncharacterized protein (TIGR02646 family) [Rossellomorea marisflavi]